MVWLPWGAEGRFAVGDNHADRLFVEADQPEIRLLFLGLVDRQRIGR